MEKIFAVWDEDKKEIISVGYGVNINKKSFFLKKDEAVAVVKTAKSNRDNRKLRVISFIIDTDNPIFE